MPKKIDRPLDKIKQFSIDFGRWKLESISKHLVVSEARNYSKI